MIYEDFSIERPRRIAINIQGYSPHEQLKKLHNRLKRRINASNEDPVLEMPPPKPLAHQHQRLASGTQVGSQPVSPVQEPQPPVPPTADQDADAWYEEQRVAEQGSGSDLGPESAQVASLFDDIDDDMAAQQQARFTHDENH